MDAGISLWFTASQTQLHSLNPSHIVFLPTGEIDTVQTSAEDLHFINALFVESFSFLRSQTVPDLDVWQLLNWTFVSLYWSYLSSLGQVEPTIYPTTESIFWYIHSRSRLANSLHLDLLSSSTTPFSKYILNIFVESCLSSVYPPSISCHWMKPIASRPKWQRLSVVTGTSTQSRVGRLCISRRCFSSLFDLWGAYVFRCEDWNVKKQKWTDFLF